MAWDPDAPGPLQPIPFSHAHHAGEFEIECLYCHSGTDRSRAAGVPSVELCMGCHSQFPPTYDAEFEDAGLVRASPRVVVGSVKAGVAVRAGAPEPDLSSVESFKHALLAADSVVYNQASSGLYIARMIEDLGLAEALEAKTVRVPTGAAVFTHLAESDSPAEIGFGQIPEIRRFADKGVALVGPLPEASP